MPQSSNSRVLEKPWPSHARGRSYIFWSGIQRWLIAVFEQTLRSAPDINVINRGTEKHRQPSIPCVICSSLRTSLLQRNPDDKMAAESSHSQSFDKERPIREIETVQSSEVIAGGDHSSRSLRRVYNTWTGMAALPRAVEADVLTNKQRVRTRCL
jgi:hypothetical protein